MRRLPRTVPVPVAVRVRVAALSVGVLALSGGGLAGIASARPTKLASTAAGPACQAQQYRQVPDPAAVPWAQSRMAFTRVWPVTQGAGVTVAVVDSGVDRHPQLGDAVTDGGDVYQPGGSARVDAAGHGTLVAGIIAARPAAGVGFAGVAPAARVLAVKVAEGECATSADAIGAGIEAAIAGGATVVNVSITSQNPSARLRQAVLDAQAHSVVVVAASGNEADSGNPTEYPAALPGVLAVAAIGADGKRAAFSGTGEQIGVAAPGDAITSLGAQTDGFGVVGGAAGTSFAAPYVTGVAALVRAEYPDLSASQVVRRIEATADHPAAGPDPQSGWGVVNPYAAVTAVLPEERQGSMAAATPQPLSAPAPRAAPPDTATHAANLVAVGAAAAAGL
ncbi:MAG: type VII secretion-associated serine protease mycosin, partial [Catenulispora sp.]|nr:type VII secretion-associated serine protease mycosin [Catenulispora sp.]